MPLTFLIVYINQGMTLPHGSQGSNTMRDQVPSASLTSPLTRAGMNSIRVCVFHLSSHVASGQVSLPHEALASMFIDCLFWWISLGVIPIWPFTGTPVPNTARWTHRAGCIKASSRTSWMGGSNHRGVCRFASRERSIAAQTVFCSLSSTRMLSAARPTKTARRSMEYFSWSRSYGCHCPGVGPFDDR